MTDLGHKITLQNTIFKAYEGSELIILTAIVNGLVLLPFIFLFLPAGSISDKYPKPKVVEYASLGAIAITTLILIAYTMGWFWVAFGFTFVLAGQSAIYSPAKYGLIKEMAGNENLAQANALVQSITIVSILAGAVVYSIFFENLLQNRAITPSQILPLIAPIGYALIGASVVEYLLARRLVTKFKAIESEQSVAFDTYVEEGSLLSHIKLLKQSQTVWLSIIGLSLLWGVAQVVVAIFGEHIKTTLGVTNTITAQAILALSGVGIIFGSLLSGRVSRHYIETGTIPLGALGVASALYMMPSLDTLPTFGLALFAFGFFAGLFIVPLSALIQFSTPNAILGKVLAGNNLMQHMSMFLFLVLTATFGYFEISSKGLFYIISTVAFGGMVYTFIQLPQSLIRYLLRMILRLKYKLEVEGLNHIPSDKGVLLLGNHISYLDWAMLQIAYPKQIRFVMEREYYDIWFLRWFFRFFKVIPISTKASKNALTLVTQALNNKKTVVLFPEGSLSRNGQLGKFQRGFERAVHGVEDGVIVPFYIRGLWEDNFSLASLKMRRKKNRDIGISFGKALPIDTKAPKVKEAVLHLSIESWQHYATILPTLPKAWIRTAKKVGSGLCIADSTGVKMSGHRCATATLMIASMLKPSLRQSQNIGIILPTSAGGAMGNMALLSLGKTIVNLNYTAGDTTLSHAIKVANISTIVTSTQFLSKLKTKGFDLTTTLEGVEVIYLEALKKKISKPKALLMLLAVKCLPTWVLSLCFITHVNKEDTAAILFSSGSENMPKGIELSHKNIMGNIKQTSTILNPNHSDIMLGTLPIFHSFGLTVTTLLPLVEGVPLVCHPDPTDGVEIGKLTAMYQATILFGTATFLRLYTQNRKLIPLMFESLRMVVAGAEKLPLEIRHAFTLKFGHQVYEGYGATETTPVASCNIQDMLIPKIWQPQMGQKVGTVGLPLPGSAFRIVDPKSFEPLAVGEAGMILIGGTQIMKGYLNDTHKTASAIKEIDGIRWYISGDKGYLDEDGFLTIIDRYSRFAKIGGEMISLGFVERELSKVLTQSDRLFVVALPDAKKGEKLVGLMEGDMEIETFKQKIKSLTINPLLLPNIFFKVEALPKLGTGKADFKGAKALARQLSQTD